MKKIIILITLLIFAIISVISYTRKDIILHFIHPQKQQLKSEVEFAKLFPEMLGNYVLRERDGGKIQVKYRGCYNIYEYLDPFNKDLCSIEVQAEYNHKDNINYSIYVNLIGMWKGDINKELIREGVGINHMYNKYKIFKIENSNIRELLWKTNSSEFGMAKILNGPFEENAVVDYFISKFPPIITEI